MVAAALGWTGTIGVLAAFMLHSTGRMSSLSVRYAVLNTVGGAISGAACVLYGAIPSAFSNLVWTVFAGRALVVALRARRTAWVVGRADERALEADDAVLAA